jgi:hypothetical protein
MPASIKFSLVLIVIICSILISDAADCSGAKDSIQQWDMWGVRELMCADQCNRQYFCEIKGQNGMRMIRIGHSGRYCWVSRLIDEYEGV